MQCFVDHSLSFCQFFLMIIYILCIFLRFTASDYHLLVLSNISQMIPHSLLFYNYPRLPIIRSHKNVLVTKLFHNSFFYQIKFIFLLSKYLPFNPSIIWDFNVSSDIYVRVCLHVTPFLELVTSYLIVVHLPK